MAFNQSSVIELCPAYPDRQAKYFKEIFVSDCCIVPPQKPSMEQVVNIQRIINYQDVQTVSVTLPGSTEPDGNKIFVAGNIYLGVQYGALVDEQSVHYFRCQIPFQTFILEDCGDLIPTDDSIFTNGYVVHVCVEKMLYKIVDERTVCFELLLLVWVEEIV